MTLGRDGWSFERFGSTVAVLRAGAVAPAAGPGSLLISCDGGERRLRLILPEPPPAPFAAPARTGAILVRPSGPGGEEEPFLVARASLLAGRTLTLADRGPPERSAVLAFVRLLERRPRHLDLLGGATGSAAFRPRPVILAPVFRPGDALALAEFRAACERSR